MIRDNQEGFYFKNSNNDYNLPCKQVTFFTTSKPTSIIIIFNNQTTKATIQRWIILSRFHKVKVNDVFMLAMRFSGLSLALQSMLKKSAKYSAKIS